MPWTFDALLPADKRYTSLKFRRAARTLYPHRLDYADAAELAAFVLSIDGVKHAKRIFHWVPYAAQQAQVLVDHMVQFPDVARMVAENREVPTRDDGLKCLRAMQDGGWTQGSVPGIVRLALLDMRDAGISQAKIGRAVGLTHDQVRNICGGIRALRPRRHAVGLAGLMAAS